MGREELFLAEHTPSHHKQQGWGSGGGSHESEEKRWEEVASSCQAQSKMAQHIFYMQM